MLRYLLLAILLVFVLRALSRLMRGVLEGAGYRRESSAPSATKLVRDPICGMFVVPGKALTASVSGQTQYFCSEACRRSWTAQRR